MKHELIKAAVLLLATGPLAASAVPVLNVDDAGHLLGAFNVEVAGTPYDVSFLNGTCAQLYHGCDDEGDFLFPNQSDAIQAGNALLDQVFINSELGMFDSEPWLTTGCVNPIACVAFTPYELTGDDPSNQILHYSRAFNWSDGNGTDSVDTHDIWWGWDTTPGDDHIFAVWTRSPQAGVPEPGMLGLLGFGAIGLGLARSVKRRRHTTG